jgi:hypothetical protein
MVSVLILDLDGSHQLGTRVATMLESGIVIVTLSKSSSTILVGCGELLTDTP